VKLTDPGWHGKGTSGRHNLWHRDRNGRVHSDQGYRAYWWLVGEDATRGRAIYCEHAHETPESAQRCGERMAAHLNRVRRSQRPSKDLSAPDASGLALRSQVTRESDSGANP
jgi:hypothetical protein